ncbi:MAG: zinc ribbon domain-containing protein YjdM [Bdellovibrionota bacterium]
MQTSCPKCQSENIYQDGNLWVCPECANEWVEKVAATVEAAVVDDGLICDANGNVLADGDSVIVLKDLNIKGSSSVVKGGTKVRNIRLRDMGDGHDILCKIDGLGAINLKSSFVKKV